MKTMYELMDASRLYDFKISEQINVSKVLPADAKPVYKMNFVAAPQQAIHKLFGQDDYNPYMLQINLHPDSSSTEREEQASDLQAKIENLGNNNVAVYGVPNNESQTMATPAILLVGCSDITVLMQQMKQDPAILGIAATKALHILEKNELPVFQDRVKKFIP